MMKKPVQMYEEAAKEYRMRCLAWILERDAPIRIDDLVGVFRKEFPTEAVAKETVARALVVMEKRGIIVKWVDEADGRAVVWTMADHPLRA